MSKVRGMKGERKEKSELGERDKRREKGIPLLSINCAAVLYGHLLFKQKSIRDSDKKRINICYSFYNCFWENIFCCVYSNLVLFILLSAWEDMYKKYIVSFMVHGGAFMIYSMADIQSYLFHVSDIHSYNSYLFHVSDIHSYNS